MPKYRRNPFVSGTVTHESTGSLTGYGYIGKDIYGRFHNSPILYKTEREAKEALMKRKFKRNPSEKVPKEFFVVASPPGNAYGHSGYTFIEKGGRFGNSNPLKARRLYSKKAAEKFLAEAKKFIVVPLKVYRMQNNRGGISIHAVG